MNYHDKRMALRAMLFVYLTFAALASAGCERRSGGYAAVCETDSVFIAAAESGDEEAENRGDAEGRTGEDGEDAEGRNGAGDAEHAESPEGAEAEIFVHVCGAVRNGGVFALPEGARVCDALEAAGGLSEDADRIGLNQARILSDGEQLVVLTEQEAEERAAGAPDGTGQGAEETPESVLININTADAEELQRLSGIGAAKAADIIAYREAHGAFQRTEDIMKVTGIKTSLFNKIKDGITVG